MSNSGPVSQPSQTQNPETKWLPTLTLNAPFSSAGKQGSSRYSLSPTEVVVIGREPECQIVIDSSQYTAVSRRHAEVRPLATKLQPAWQICDLNSANGTYVNGKRLEGCQLLRSGDRIMLGKDGPEFIFEFKIVSAQAEPQSNLHKPLRSQSTSCTTTRTEAACPDSTSCCTSCYADFSNPATKPKKSVELEHRPGYPYSFWRPRLSSFSGV
jgi:pSer/pThr/pTyr-binding forkhead associated (FHA) protein